MPELTISPSNPIHFEIKTGTGTINDGVTTIDANFIYRGIDGYWNAPALGNNGFNQPFNCDDTTLIQIIFENGGAIPFIEIVDSDGIHVSVLAWVIVATDIYDVAIDWSLLDCGACYQIRITSVTGVSNFWPCGDSGTFESGIAGFTTGGTNTLTQSAAESNTGSFSAKVEAPISPGPSETLIGTCTSAFTLTANTIYHVSGFIFDDLSTPFTQDGRSVAWDISDFTDAVTIFALSKTPSVDLRGVWHFIEIWFRTGSDVMGQLKIVTNADPQQGIIYMDDLRIETGVEVLEAESECISLKENHPWTNLLTWNNDDNTSSLFFGASEVFTMRLEASAVEFKMDDPDFLVRDDTRGVTSQQRSVSYKVYELVTGLLSPSMIESLSLALKHDNVTFRGIPITCETQNLSPEWEEDQPLAILKADVRVKTYNQQNGSC